MNKYICIHGHFYQPPRENAWLENVEIQDSAYPFHDWNEKITSESYAPNTAARILEYERITDIVNNYAHISFNFGPTLLSWLARELPEVYKSIIDSDKESRDYFSGHGSAMAQVYNHIIMPLANQRDKETQVIWGIRDFEYRFGRKPEGMWLSETAVNTDTLEALAKYDIKFTVLSPYQAAKTRKIGEKNWNDVTGAKVDPKHPYICHLPSGKSINLFFYDGPISQEIGFGNVLKSGENFAERLMSAFIEDDEPQLVHIATDGETYGHHKIHGEMALAYCLYHIQNENLAQITNYAQYLELQPPQDEARIIENTSWSCSHGIERWKSDCGCNTGMRGDWNQKWRQPLREALDWLRDRLIPYFENNTKNFLRDPWQARNDYISVLVNRNTDTINRFFTDHQAKDLSREEKKQMLKLLELQRHAMLMYTSCGWFFDELSGIETTQVMQYAARAIQLARDLTGDDFEPGFLEIMSKAISNIKEFGNGADIYKRFIVPTRIDLKKVGIHYAISSLFSEYSEKSNIYCYSAKSEKFDKSVLGKMSLGYGKALISSNITWSEEMINFSVLHLGGHIINCGVKPFYDDNEMNKIHSEIKQAFDKSDVPEVIRLIDHYYNHENYSLMNLFKDEQRRVINLILESVFEEIETHFRQIFEEDYHIMYFMKELQIPTPKAIKTPAEFILNNDIRRMLNSENIDFDRLEQLIREYVKLGIEPDNELSYEGNKKIISLVKNLSKTPDNIEQLQKIYNIIHLLSELNLDIDFWEATNIFFLIGRQKFDEFKSKAEAGDEKYKFWIDFFNKISYFLNLSFG